MQTSRKMVGEFRRCRSRRSPQEANLARIRATGGTSQSPPGSARVSTPSRSTISPTSAPTPNPPTPTRTPISTQTASGSASNRRRRTGLAPRRIRRSRVGRATRSPARKRSAREPARPMKRPRIEAERERQEEIHRQERIAKRNGSASRIAWRRKPARKPSATDRARTSGGTPQAAGRGRTTGCHAMGRPPRPPQHVPRASPSRQ